MKKIFQKSYKYRLKPTKEQWQLFAQYAGASRYVFNFGLEQVKIALEVGTKIPTYTDLCKMLTRLKVSKEWLQTIHSQTLQQVLKNLTRSVSAYFLSKRKKEKKNVGFPDFKKRGRSASFRYPQYIRCENGLVFLPKIGWVKYRDSRPIEGTIKQATVKRQGDHWYVCITCDVEMEVPEIVITEDTVLGIDVGISHFITTSQGKQIPNPRYLQQLLEKVRYQSKALSRKKKYGNNWRKTCARLRRLHSRISNMRADFLHKVSTMLTKSHGVSMLCVEDLNIKGMIQNRKLSRAISDASWGMFNELLRYKSLWNGKYFVQVDRFYPSSKLCSSCGNKQEMPLNMRVFGCDSCGLKLDRDINAAINLRSFGITELKTYGEIRMSSLNEVGSCGF